MKPIILNISLMMMFSFFQINSFAQSKVKTDTLTVFGNCGECKTRIEEAAYIKGVKHAEWDKTTKILTVVYNDERTSLDKISASIANAGHDNPYHKSKDKNYNKLPSCCAYRTGECNEH